MFDLSHLADTSFTLETSRRDSWSWLCGREAAGCVISVNILRCFCSKWSAKQLASLFNSHNFNDEIMNYCRHNILIATSKSPALVFTNQFFKSHTFKKKGRSMMFISAQWITLNDWLIINVSSVNPEIDSWIHCWSSNSIFLGKQREKNGWGRTHAQFFLYSLPSCRFVLWPCSFCAPSIFGCLAISLDTYCAD